MKRLLPLLLLFLFAGSLSTYAQWDPIIPPHLQNKNKTRQKAKPTTTTSKSKPTPQKLVTVANSRTFTANGVSFTMIPVEGGTFTMLAGSRQGREVTLSSYCIGQVEVTQELWYTVMGHKPTTDEGHQWNAKFGLGNNFPTYFVSWNDCQEFIRKLNNLTGETFRLPTAAEWEFAARGGNKSKGYKYSGSNTVGNVAWYDGNSSGKTHPVASKAPNELGIYDMNGNACEWCADWEGALGNSSQANPAGPTSETHRVARGGNCRESDFYCLMSCWESSSPSSRDDIRGLRLAL